MINEVANISIALRARNAIEILATSLITRLLGPVFYYVLFGFVGVSLYHIIAAMNSKIGHKTDRYKEFGITTRRVSSIILLANNMILLTRRVVIPNSL